VARKIISQCDIVSENFATGVMSKWGLDYDSVKQLRPDIIYISSSNMGQTGPQAGIAATGNQLVALTGLTHLTGWPDRVPSQPYAGITDTIAPRFGVAALLAALDHRINTGKGQHLDLSQFEAGLQFLSPVFLDYFANGREAMRAGNRAPTAAPHNAYRCRGEDRWCVIAVETEDEWQRFSHALGNPSWTRNARFATLKSRKRHEEELDRLVEEWTKCRTAEEIMEKLQAVGVAAAVVSNAEDICSDAQLKHRQFLQPLEHPDMGTVDFQAHGFKLSRTPAEIHSSPSLGQHTEYILREVLSLSDEEVLDLLSSGVLC